MLRIFSDLKEVDPSRPRAVVLGKFDGIHLGHQELLKRILPFRREGLTTLVCTFAGPLSAVFSNEEPLSLTTNAERSALLSGMGMEELLLLPVSRDFLSTPPERFVREILLGDLNAAVIVSGPDCTFGAGGKGDLALLKRLALKAGSRVLTVEKVRLLGEDISSSRIRSLVREGEMEKAAMLLGLPYSLEGRVCHGRKLGRQIDMPTVNLLPPAGKLLPPFGVYEAEVSLGSERFPGVSNLGVKPTVSGSGSVVLETHLFDFSEDLYGEDITVSLLRFERPERKFQGVDELKTAMHSDMLKAKSFFAQRDG